MNLVGVLTYPDVEKQVNLLKKYKNYIFAAEIRVDTFYPKITAVTDVLKKIKTKLPKIKIILTFRSKQEGGKINIQEKIRKDILYRIVNENHRYIDYVDIEYKSKIKNDIIKLAKFFSKKIILSYHFIKPVSKIAFTKVLNLVKKDVDKNKQNIVVKIVANTDNFDLYFQLLKELYNSKLNFTFFTIGGTSLISRCFGLLLDMPLIYAGILTPVIKTQPNICDIINLARKIGITN